jgi:hypothetical protein
LVTHQENITKKNVKHIIRKTTEFNSRLTDVKEDKRVLMNHINNTLAGQNHSRNKVEIIPIQAKQADSSIVGSSSYASSKYLPPKVEVDRYHDAFRTANMGPHSRSFVMFTPRIEEKIREKRKVKVCSLIH